MKTWSDPLNSEDKRMLFAFIYDIDFGWIGKRFDTEDEANTAGEIYAECKRNNSIPENAHSIIDMVWHHNKFPKPLSIKLKNNCY